MVWEYPDSSVRECARGYLEFAVEKRRLPLVLMARANRVLTGEPGLVEEFTVLLDRELTRTEVDALCRSHLLSYRRSPDQRGHRTVPGHAGDDPHLGRPAPVRSGPGAAHDSRPVALTRVWPGLAGFFSAARIPRLRTWPQSIPVSSSSRSGRLPIDVRPVRDSK